MNGIVYLGNIMMSYIIVVIQDNEKHVKYYIGLNSTIIR